MSVALHVPAVGLRRPNLPPWIGKIGWAVVSIGMFCAIWEALWAAGLADPRLLPPPHVFLGNIAGQAKFFTIALIGTLGFAFDFALRLLQNRLLYWVPKGSEALRGL